MLVGLILGLYIVLIGYFMYCIESLIDIDCLWVPYERIGLDPIANSFSNGHNDFKSCLWSMLHD